jgi:phosphatidylglycerol:prolipoprotein diacylglycerol transferase
MYPIIAAFRVPWLDWIVQLEAYPLMHFLALLVLVAVTLRLYARDIGPSGPALDALLVAVPAGMVGANLLAAWTAGQAPTSPLPAPRLWWMGGKSAYGGLLLGTAAGALLTRLRGLSVARLFDAAAPGLALGACLARVGCFLGGCCWGRPTASFLGVHFPDGHPGRDVLLPGDPRGLHPTQLYLAAAALGIAILLLVLRRQGAGRPGSRFRLAATLYAVTVFGVEFLRGDTGRWFAAGLSHSQWISLAILAASLATAVRRPRALRAAVAAVTMAVVLTAATRVAAADASWSRDAALDALQVIVDALPGNRGEATALLGELASIGGDGALSTWARLGLGTDAFLAGDVDRGMAEWKAAAAAAEGTPAGAQAELAVGLGAIVSGDRTAAEHAFRAAATSEEGDTAALAEVSLGRLLAADGDLGGAERSFRHALEAAPRSGVADDAALGLAQSLLGQGRRAEARATAARAVHDYDRRARYVGAGRDRSLRWDRIARLGPRRAALALRARAVEAAQAGRSPLDAVVAALTDRYAGPDLRRLHRRLGAAVPGEDADASDPERHPAAQPSSTDVAPALATTTPSARPAAAAPGARLAWLVALGALLLLAGWPRLRASGRAEGGAP